MFIVGSVEMLVSKKQAFWQRNDSEAGKQANKPHTALIGTAERKGAREGGVGTWIARM